MSFTHQKTFAVGHQFHFNGLVQAAKVGSADPAVPRHAQLLSLFLQWQPVLVKTSEWQSLPVISAKSDAKEDTYMSVLR